MDKPFRFAMGLHPIRVSETKSSLPRHFIAPFVLIFLVMSKSSLYSTAGILDGSLRVECAYNQAGRLKINAS